MRNIFNFVSILLMWSNAWNPLLINNTMRRLIFLSCCLSVALGVSAADKEPVDYVDCFTGTSNSRWMLGPYAQVPFGIAR